MKLKVTKTNVVLKLSLKEWGKLGSIFDSFEDHLDPEGAYKDCVKMIEQIANKFAVAKAKRQTTNDSLKISNTWF